MDWVKCMEHAAEYLKKYRFVLLILLTGLILMALPEKKTETHTEGVQTPQESESLEEALEEILSLIDGAGRVAVLLTQKEGEEILYQTDEDTAVAEASSDIQRKTVMTTDSSRQETGLIRQINPPVLRGAVILCQGANNPKVKLAVVEAVMRATGLPSNCISVLKMK